MKTVTPLPKAAAEHEHTCTEFELHAYLDGELASAERAKVIMAAQHSPAIWAQLNELKHLREMIRNSYAEIDLSD